jgi:hypothetical protein
MPCPSHPPWLDHFNYTWRRVQVKNASSVVWENDAYTIFWIWDSHIGDYEEYDRVACNSV